MSKADLIRAGSELGAEVIPRLGAAARRSLVEAIDLLGFSAKHPSAIAAANETTTAARALKPPSFADASFTNASFANALGDAERFTRANNAKLEGLFRHGELTESPRSRDSRVSPFVTSGYVDDAAGKSHHVVMKAVDSERRVKEVAAYELHKHSQFTNHFPVTVERQHFIVQERVGKSLEDRAIALDRKYFPRAADTFVDFENRPSFVTVFDNSPSFRAQVEEAVAQGTVFGIKDSHEANYAAAMIKRKLTVSNIDMADAFTTDYIPPKSLIPFLRGRPINDGTLNSVSNFVDMIESPFGRGLVRDVGLSNAQRAAMTARSTWLLNTRVFPR